MKRLIRSVSAVAIVPDVLETYLELHARQPDAVRAAMRAANIEEYRMYLLRSQNIVISVSERVAATATADALRMAQDPVMIDWLTTCRAMQARLPGERHQPPSLWSPLPEVYAL
jgi:L-rhamnose mutarotase